MILLSVYVTAYKGAGNESGMFDVTEICFTSLVQSSVGLSVCVCCVCVSVCVCCVCVCLCCVCVFCVCVCVCLCVCCVGELPGFKTRGRSCHTTRTAYVRSGFCFGAEDERMPEGQVWSRGGRTAGTGTVPSCF
jgi:hypothetical protein